MADTAVFHDSQEKTPTGNKILTKAGELIAMAKGLKVRAAERAKIKGPDCPMAEAEADFAVAIAEHVFQLDGEWCKDHARVNRMADDISVIKRCAKWTLGLLASTVGVGGFWQVCQWGWAIIKHIAAPLAMFVALGGCSVRAYPPLDAQGQPTALPVIIRDHANPPADPTSFLDLLLAVGGGLLGVQVLGGVGKGGIAVARRVAAAAASRKRQG